MVDNFAILVSHALIAIAIWRLVRRDDLDRDPAVDTDRRRRG